MSKRLLSLLLSLILIMATLISCGGRGSEENTEEESGFNVTVTAEAPSDDRSEPQEISLIDYRIVYSTRANAMLVSSIGEFKATLENCLGTAVESVNDRRVTDSESATEIVIGAAERAEITDAKYDLREGDYLIRYQPESRRILILGSDDTYTVNALKYVTEHLLDTIKKTLVLPASGTYYGLAEYPIRSFAINGVNISRYTVVVPQDADLLTYYAGVNIVDFFTTQMGVTISMHSDTVRETQYEILVGKTNREESKVTCTLSDGQYAMFLKNGKLVLQGNTYMIGGGFGMLVKDSVDLSKTNAAIQVNGFSDTPVAKDFVYAETCTNAILMIGDGMGYGHIEMALKNGLDAFVAQSLPYAGESVTRSQSVINGSAAYTDSAAAATALACGYKTFNRTIGRDSKGFSVPNVRELASACGAQTAVVTTDVITGATPGGFLVHVPDRGQTADIQVQIWELITTGQVDYCVGSVGDGLLMHTIAALNEVSDSADPFFVMIEDHETDKYSHGSDMKNTYHAVTRLNESVAYAIGFALCHPGTALIVTADHETGGLTRADSIADLNGVLSIDSINSHYNKITSDIEKYGYTYTTFGSHTNVNVPIYAIGSGTERFHGTVNENIEIAKFLAGIFGDKNFGQK